MKKVYLSKKDMAEITIEYKKRFKITLVALDKNYEKKDKYIFKPKVKSFKGAKKIAKALLIGKMEELNEKF